MVPSQFQEIIVRIYTRDSNKVCAVQRAFRRLLKTFDAKIPGDSPYSITPNAALEIPEDFASPRKRRWVLMPKYQLYIIINSHIIVNVMQI
jgi:hypothetical protein